MKIISVVGARPNFMKIAPLIHAINDYNNLTDQPIVHILVHTGQHYDDRMSNTFFEELNIPEADINLGVGSGSHAEQVGQTMIEFEKVLRTEKPDWVVVVGDVNATLACSVTAKKENIRCCHIEAGLRSGDITMPEEVNRLVTDRLSDLLLTPDKISIDNLLKEGVPMNKIRFVGNIMIDTLEKQRIVAAKLEPGEIINRNTLLDRKFADKILQKGGFALITLHRPSNVDKIEVFKPILDFITDEVAKDMPVVWPLHPRTQKQIELFGLWGKVEKCENLILLHPIGYLDMLRLNMEANIMLTDSGGLQEECTILGTPCLTLRWNTERPVTLRENGGASILVGNNISRIREEYSNTRNKIRKIVRPELWDGKTAARCVQEIINY